VAELDEAGITEHFDHHDIAFRQDPFDGSLSTESFPTPPSSGRTGRSADPATSR